MSSIYFAVVALLIVNEVNAGLSKPTNLKMVETKEKNIITWDQVQGAVSYNVRFGKVPLLNVVKTISVARFEFKDAELGASYQIRVKAVNDEGEVGEEAVEIFLVLGDFGPIEPEKKLPGKPRNIKIIEERIGTGLELIVKWDLPLENPDLVVEYDLEMGKLPDIVLSNVLVDGREFRTDKFEPNTKYWVQLAATSINGNGEFIRFDFTSASSSLKPPKDISFEKLTDSDIFLSWTDPNTKSSSSGHHYQIQYRQRGTQGKFKEREASTCAQIKLPTKQCQMLIKGLKGGKEYDFQMRVASKGETSEWTADQVFTPSAAYNNYQNY